MQRIHQRVAGKLKTPCRHGLTTPAVAIALLVIMMGLALIIDRIWLETAQLELRIAAESAALAAAAELANDLSLSPSQSNVLQLQNARETAAWIASQNHVGGSPVTLNAEPDGDVRFGHLEQESDGTKFEETNSHPNTVVVTALRTRASNNPVALFISGATGQPFGDVAARAEATINNDIVGLRAFEGTPIPAIPIAILQRDPTGQRTDTWENMIETRGGADGYSWDNESHTVVALADGIPEMVIRSLRTGGKTTDCNVLMLDIGTERNDAELARQFESGITTDDLESFDGVLWLGQSASVSLTASPNFYSAQTAALQKIIGERRICFLYSTTSPQNTPPVVTATCPEIVSVRVMAVKGYSDGSCDLVVQPTVLTTRTALLSTENINSNTDDITNAMTHSLANTISNGSTSTASNAVPNRYVYKLRLTH